MEIAASIQKPMERRRPVEMNNIITTKSDLDNSRLYRCKGCSKSFKSRNTITRHKYCKTDKVRPSLKCNQCSKNFASKNYLHHHLRNHAGDCSFKCPICGRGFVINSLLTNHMIVHTDKRNFLCEQCGYRFKTKSALKTHYRVHANKQLYCKLCNRGFETESGFMGHIYEHPGPGEKSFSCGLCLEAFEDSLKLSSHLKTHNEIRYHECDVCNKRFYAPKELILAQNYNKSNFVEIVTYLNNNFNLFEFYIEVRSFQCLDCESTFRRKDNLTQHIKRVHVPDDEEKEHAKELPDVATTSDLGFLNGKDTLMENETHPTGEFNFDAVAWQLSDLFDGRIF